ncbi:MAG: L,D-transpeptidase family protein [Gammaproteobacteria bacterium]|nr:L,D-transpeptidase family protein [Gammaproteobacteria bacterium]
MRIYGTIGSILLLTVLVSPAPRADILSPHYEKADSLLIVKSERKLYLLKEGEVLRDFDIALGLMPEGPKEREGDFRTPEGLYYLDARNPNSDYFLSLHISYPNGRDIARARAQGVDPGGQIMIHGQPNEPKYSESRYESWDWTDGCIAVSNSDMVDIWLMTEEGTPIEIRP